jgi:hypothetical protein
MMDTDPLWPFFLITHVSGIVVGTALASLWWRQHCSRLTAGEAQRRRDRRERIERLTAPAESGGGKTRDRAATVGDVLAHVHRTGHVPPVDAPGRPLPPLPDADVPEPWQKADRLKLPSVPPPGQPEPPRGRPPPSGDWYLTKEVPEDRRR